MRHVLLLCLGLFLTLARLPAAEGNPEAWLLGEWKSNGELTFPTLKTAKPLSPEMKEAMSTLFGKMTLNFDKEFCLAVMPEVDFKGRKIKGARDKSKYYVVSSTEKTISVRMKDHRTMKEYVQVLTFETPDRFWVELPKDFPIFSGRECYDRVVKKDDTKPTPAPTPQPAKPAI